MKNIYRSIYLADKRRYHNRHENGLHYTRLLRKCQYSTGIIHRFYLFLLHRLELKYGLEISWKCKIGKGLYLGHAFNITINEDAEIGEFCNIHKGVTIGQQNRGRHKGVPKIGNKVWIGVNATIVGKIVVGDDVLIAPGAFVNCDVPSHSIVIGNPCLIHHRDSATEGYINNV